jgi:predicted RNA-binding Zn-ribbon protein involved in translation (DUF1610 family)
VFLTILHAKAESAGREVIAVDPRNTSRTCPECGHVSAENRPAQEKFHCVACGHTAHADTVGALNVLRAGPVRSVARPTRLSEKPPDLSGGGVTASGTITATQLRDAGAHVVLDSLEDTQQVVEGIERLTGMRTAADTCAADTCGGRAAR